jgi:hypothetical protein
MKTATSNANGIRTRQRDDSMRNCIRTPEQHYAASVSPGSTQASTPELTAAMGRTVQSRAFD